MVSKLRSFAVSIGAETLRAVKAGFPRGLPLELKSNSFNAETLRALMHGQEIGERVGVSYRSIVTHGYERNVCILRAISEIASGAASVPIDVYVGDEKVDDHPLENLLERPNLSKTKTRFFNELLSYYLLDGNGFVVAITAPGEQNGQPLALQTLRPDLVEVTRIRPGLIGSTVYTYKSEETAAAQRWVVSDLDETSPVMHLRTFDAFDRPRGFPPLIAARSAIDRHNLADEWNANVIRNGAKPPGVLLVDRGKEGDASLTDPERESIKAMLDEMVGGAKNAGRPFVLEGGLRWQQTGWSPTDIDWSGGKASAARDAVNALGFPPMLLGIPGDNTFSNQREARLALWENTIIPLLGFTLDEITQWLGPRYGGNITLKPNLDQVPALALRRERVWERVKGAEWLSVNEQREETGLDQRTEAEANAILVSYSKVPLEQLSQSVILTQPDTGSDDVEPGAEDAPADDAEDAAEE
jgi:HK97 family phage portal protein